eukprot:m.137998 g.137998  ORF g.137998 m.137998 type:complete len:441 (-) comp13991_c0_seq1:650-1972(-)
MAARGQNAAEIVWRLMARAQMTAPGTTAGVAQRRRTSLHPPPTGETSGVRLSRRPCRQLCPRPHLPRLCRQRRRRPLRRPPCTSPTLSPTMSPSRSPSTAPTQSPTSIISGAGCSVHRQCGPASWCRNDSLCILCNLPGSGSLCSPGVSATGVCPGKCGTVPPTAATLGPVTPPPAHCRSHRTCVTTKFCNSSNECDGCALCGAQSSISGICPVKCLSIIAQSQPTAATDRPTALPTGASLAPITQRPGPAPILADCRHHRNCPITHFCAGPIGRCAACAQCTRGSGGSSINGKCPAKCSAPQATTTCRRHYECDSVSSCHATSRECVPCLNFVIGGAAEANCTSISSITGICPTKCLSVLNPSAVSSGVSTDSAAGSDSATPLPTHLPRRRGCCNHRGCHARCSSCHGSAAGEDRRRGVAAHGRPRYCVRPHRGAAGVG